MGTQPDLEGLRRTRMVELTYSAYSCERRFLRAMLRLRRSSRVLHQADMRYAAIYVIGWGCA